MDNPGRLISLLYRKAQIYWTHSLKQYQISTAEYPILIYLNHQDGVTQEEIATALNIDKSAVTRNIQSLCEKGLTERRKDEEDRRCNRVFLTKEGQESKEPIEQTKKEWNNILMKNMSKKEKTLFLQLLMQAAENISDITTP